MIAVDSSALVAIYLGEPTAPRLRSRLASETVRVLSAANYVETGQVIAQRRRVSAEDALSDFHEFLDLLAIETAPVDEAQARVALAARLKYGRGFGHPARLNYSGCFAYALAKTRRLPLLYVGDDFVHTDVVPALT